MNKRPRVLLVAHHANPDWGSEPLIGWSWANALAEKAAVTLVTHVRNRHAIENRCGLSFRVRYVQTERLASWINCCNDRLWHKAAVLNRSLLESISLWAFDRGAVHIAKDEIAAKGVDVIHRVSPISIRARTSLGTLGVPLILGPMNGGMGMPEGFETISRRERSKFARLRRFARLFDPFGTTFSSAAHLLVARPDLMEQLPDSVRSKASVVSENAISEERIRYQPARLGRGLSVLYLGRLIPCKGAGFLVRAMAELSHRRDIQLDIVGDGPERAELEAFVQQHQLRDRVRFVGAVSTDQVSRVLGDCDVLALPSVRESGGGVILEAMAAGRAVVALNHGGPATLIDHGSGILLSPRDEESVVSGLKETLIKLADHPKERIQMGQRGYEVVRTKHLWSHRVDVALELYRKATQAKVAGITTDYARNRHSPEGGARC